MMKTSKKIGIYLDHAAAQLIEFSDTPKGTRTIVADFNTQDKHETLERSESEMHNKEQQRQRAYFKLLFTSILPYEEVLLFGPTEAKTELLHFLRHDHKFENTSIDVQNTDRLTANQQHAFVRNYFKKFDFKMR